MLEAKWSIDPGRGKGHLIEKTLSLFDETELSDYPNKLWNFLSGADYRTNAELYIFGLENGFLPKHTNDILKKNKTRFRVVGLDDKNVRGNYIKI